MNEDIIIRIGEGIRELRIAKGYTSYEMFAYDNNLSRVQYWRIEKGKTNITINSLVKILNIHNISISEFFNSI